MTQARPSRVGFTLIEVVVALAILTGGILGVIAAFRTSWQLSSSSSRKLQALYIAQRELELAVTVPADRLVGGEQTSGIYRWTVSYATQSRGVTMALVLVEWQEQGTPKQFQLARAFMPPADQGGEP